METIIGGWIEVGVATRSHAPGSACGDAWTVARGDGAAVVAVADGVGHGAEAASAARRSMEVIEAGGSGGPEGLLQQCHQAARGTRGVAMSLASVDPINRLVSWLGVGNVAAILVRPGPASCPVIETLRPGEGLVGGRLPALQPATFRVEPGDRLVLATDGVAGDFADDLNGEAGDASSAREAAEAILQRHATGRDDALVVVARFLRWPS